MGASVPRHCHRLPYPPPPPPPPSQIWCLAHNAKQKADELSKTWSWWGPLLCWLPWSDTCFTTWAAHQWPPVHNGERISAWYEQKKTTAAMGECSRLTHEVNQTEWSENVFELKLCSVLFHVVLLIFHNLISVILIWYLVTICMCVCLDINGKQSLNDRQYVICIYNLKPQFPKVYLRL